MYVHIITIDNITVIITINGSWTVLNAWQMASEMVDELDGWLDEWFVDHAWLTADERGELRFNGWTG